MSQGRSHGKVCRDDAISRNPLHGIGALLASKAERSKICRLIRHAREWARCASRQEPHASLTKLTLAVIDERWHIGDRRCLCARGLRR